MIGSELRSVDYSVILLIFNIIDHFRRYEHDTDKTFTQLKFIRSDGLPMGVITWYAVHATSMNNTNKLVSSDNVGLASILFEGRMNKKYTNLIGKVGLFVKHYDRDCVMLLFITLEQNTSYFLKTSDVPFQVLQF